MVVIALLWVAVTCHAPAGAEPVVVQSTSGLVPIAVYWDAAAKTLGVGAAHVGYRFSVLGTWTPIGHDTYQIPNGLVGDVYLNGQLHMPAGSGASGLSAWLLFVSPKVYTDTSGYHSSVVQAFIDSPTVVMQGASVDYIVSLFAENVRPNPANVANLAAWLIGRTWIDGHPDIAAPPLRVRAARPEHPALILRAAPGQTAPLIRCEDTHGQAIGCWP